MMPGVSVRERDKAEARRVKRALRIEGFPSFVLVSFVFVDAGCACAGEDSKWKLPRRGLWFLSSDGASVFTGDG
jgi:hypothetical protein